MIDWLVFLIPSVVGVLYAITGVCFIIKGDLPWATVWLAYAIANFAMVMIGSSK